MYEIILAVIWFCVLGGFVNVLQYFFGLTYQKHWWFFTFIFLVIGVPGIVVTTGLNSNVFLFNTPGIFLGVVSALAYINLEFWWDKNYKITDMYRIDTVPESYHQLLAPNAASAVTKMSEILIQDIVLLVIVTQLLQFHFSYFAIGSIFAAIVFLVHIPAPVITGKIYGVILMTTATVCAFFIPYIISNTPLGFYIIFLFHLMFYVGILFWSHWMHIKTGK